MVKRQVYLVLLNTMYYFYLAGDVVGPGFFVPHLNAENLMRRPYGCGEQNMFNFAVNLYNLKFLKVCAIYNCNPYTPAYAFIETRSSKHTFKKNCFSGLQIFAVVPLKFTCRIVSNCGPGGLDLFLRGEP